VRGGVKEKARIGSKEKIALVGVAPDLVPVAIAAIRVFGSIAAGG